MSENPEKYRDCRTDLIGGGGNTDVWPGRQTPSRRHWFKLPCWVLNLVCQKAEPWL